MLGGAILSDGGRGITVAGIPDRSVITTRARELLTYAYSQGYGRADLIRLIEELS